jgi:hypothetical protein
MCKLFMIANTKKINRGKLTGLLHRAADIITANDKDGFGWAVQGKSGKIFGERYLGNKGIDFPLLIPQGVPARFRKIFKGSACEKFGTPEDSLRGALLVHARASTNEIALKNSHPHRTDAFTLIHNGVVDYTGDKYERKSTCDTEHLVHAISSGGVKEMVDKCSGWYAVGAIEHSTGHFYLIKDSRTSLHGTFVKELDSLVFGTSADQLRKILDAMKWKHGKITEVEENVAMKFDTNGEALSYEEIKPVSRWPVTTSRSYNNGFCDGYSSGYSEIGDDWKPSAEKKLPITNLTATEEKSSVESNGSTTTTIKDSTSIVEACDHHNDGISAESIAALVELDEERRERNATPKVVHPTDEELKIEEKWYQETMDEEYQIVNAAGREISYEEFECLMRPEQMLCDIFTRKSGFRHDIASFV